MADRKFVNLQACKTAEIQAPHPTPCCMVTRSCAASQAMYKVLLRHPEMQSVRHQGVQMLLSPCATTCRLCDSATSSKVQSCIAVLHLLKLCHCRQETMLCNHLHCFWGTRWLPCWYTDMSTTRPHSLLQPVDSTGGCVMITWECITGRCSNVAFA